MRIANPLRGNQWLGLSLVLLAGASHLAAQTAQDPIIAVAAGQLRFAHQTGTNAPPAQTLRVFSAPSPLQFTATATSVGGWLRVNNSPVSAIGTTGTATADIAVSVDPIGIATPGEYTGEVVLSAGSRNVRVAVALTVAAAPQVRLDPNAINITLEAGATRNISIAVGSTSTTPVTWIATPGDIQPASNWLSVSSSGQSGGQAIVTINGAAIAAGTGLAVGSLRFQTFTQGSGTVTVPVTVQIGAPAQLVVSPASLTFPFQVGFQPPGARSVNVTTTGSAPVLYTASVASGTWFTIGTSAAGGQAALQAPTGTPFFVVPNVAVVGNVPGTYEGTIQVSSSGTAPQTISARLVVSTTPQLSVFQDPPPFNYTLGGTLPQPSTITITSTGGTNLSFTAQAIPQTGGDWFTINSNSGITPTQITISVSTTRLSQLTAGTYTGVVRLTSGTTTTDVPVSLVISGSALLTVEGSPIRIEGRQGETPAPRSLNVRSTDNSSQQFSLSVDPPSATWLVLTQTGGNTGPGGTTISVAINPLAVTGPGTYEATLVITPTTTPGAPAFRVPVTYVVAGSAQLTANPASLTLTQTGATPPVPQTIQITGPQGLTFNVAPRNATWIQLTQATGTLPGQFVASFQTGQLAPGTYSGFIDVLVAGLPTLSIPVNLTVTSAATLNVGPASLNFTFTQGSATPAAQNIQLTSSGAALPFTATPSSNAPWLSVTPREGTTALQGGTPTNLSVTVNPAGLTPGTYQGSIVVASTAASNPSTTINVTLVVSTPSVPANLTIVSAASGAAASVSPGHIVTIKGRNMAPATGLEARIVNNVVQTTLGEVRVTFDGVEAPLLYVGPSGDRIGDQINAIVPYGVGNRLSTRIVVEYRNQRSEPIELRVAETAPAIFTQNQSGAGPGAILNQNNTVNGLANAATPGSIIQIFATGEGAVSPAGNDGRVIGTDLRQPLAPVTVRINGVVAEVTYAGSAPGLVSGVIQVNARIPATVGVAAPTSLPIELQVGNNVSQRGVTVAVRP